MNRLISVIIPVYNHASALEKSLFSLFRQTHRPLEVIIANDGSTDEFDKVVEKVRAKINLDIKIITQKHQGASTARNRGFVEAVGQYVIFWDADTIADPRMLEKMFAALENNPDKSYAYSQFRFGWKKMPSHPFDAEMLRKNNYIDTVSLIRRADFTGFDEKLKRFQDWDLWLTLLEKNKTGVFVPEVLYKKLVGLRRGISAWLPGFVYRLPWKIKPVREYIAAREIILKKHGNI